MSFFGKIGSWLGKNALELLGFGAGVGTNLWNQHNQNKQNEFNADQAQLNRNFQAEQAQLARDYQTEFYETYQSPNAMVRQYQDAGLNPALMAGGYNPPSAVSTSVPSGSAASATSPNYQSMESMVNMIGQMAQLKAVIDNTKADTDLKLSQAGLNTSQIDLNKLSGAEVEQRTKLLISQTSNEDEKRGLIALQKMSEYWNTENLKMDKLKKDWEREYYNIYKSYPSETLWGTIRNMVEVGRRAGKSFFDSISDIINFASSQGKSFLGSTNR